jgi:hypothetical protein
MAKFYGEIGFGHTVESPTGSGVYKKQITEKSYYGDVIRNTRQVQEGEKVNEDLSVNNSISIVADAYASENFFAMTYIKWAGAYWVVSDVDASQRPRLVLRLGGVYNGPKAAAPDTP